MKKQAKRLTLDQMKAKRKSPSKKMLQKLTSGVRGGEGNASVEDKKAWPSHLSKIAERLTHYCLILYAGMGLFYIISQNSFKQVKKHLPYSQEIENLWFIYFREIFPLHSRIRK